MGLFVVKSRYEEGLLRARFPEYSAYALTTLASRLRRIGA
jgi:protein-S-isoprenylcysteine O-methyltransferase Ste14